MSLAFLKLVNSLGGFKYLIFKMQNRGVTGVYEHRTTIFEGLADTPSEIIFLGDSISEACEWAELFENKNVKNRGIAGDLTEGVLLRLPEVLSSKPDKIFLMIGVNDLISNDPAHVLKNYRKIIEKIQSESPQTNLFVQSLLPVNNDLRKTMIKNEDILQINQELKVMAQNFKVKYIDLYSELKDDTGKLDAKYTVDGIHLNGPAYLKWKSVIQEDVNREQFKL